MGPELHETVMHEQTGVARETRGELSKVGSVETFCPFVTEGGVLREFGCTRPCGCNNIDVRRHNPPLPLLPLSRLLFYLHHLYIPHSNQ